MSVPVCLKGHLMTKLDPRSGTYSTGSWVCDKCGQKFHPGSRWVCLPCQYDLCFNCQTGRVAAAFHTGVLPSASTAASAPTPVSYSLQPVSPTRPATSPSAVPGILPVHPPYYPQVSSQPGSAAPIPYLISTSPRFTSLTPSPPPPAYSPAFSQSGTAVPSPPLTTSTPLPQIPPSGPLPPFYVQVNSVTRSSSLPASSSAPSSPSSSPSPPFLSSSSPSPPSSSCSSSSSSSSSPSSSFSTSSSTAVSSSPLPRVIPASTGPEVVRAQSWTPSGTATDNPEVMALRRRVMRQKEKKKGLKEELQRCQQAVQRQWSIRLSDIQEPTAVARGALGQVFRARWRFGPIVALKQSFFLSQDLATQASMGNIVLAEAERQKVIGDLLKECNINSQLRHPNIVAYYGIVVDDHATEPVPLYLMMEWMPGGTLLELLERHRKHQQPMAVERKLQLIRDIVSALWYLHSLGILHLDVKPANVLLDSLAQDSRAKLADMGEAYAIRKNVSQETLQRVTNNPKLVGVGTPLYMAPEMYVDAVEKSPAADMFSCGVLVAEIGSLEPPSPLARETFDPASGRSSILIEEERRAHDIDLIPDPFFKHLATQLIRNKTSSRWSAEQVIRYLGPPS